jgi:hypothetical protein
MGGVKRTWAPKGSRGRAENERLTTMGTSKSNTGGTGGAWTDFKRDASWFARKGGDSRAARTLGGHVATFGGAQDATAAAGAGIRTGQSLARFLVGSTGPDGLAGGLEEVGLSHLIGAERFAILSELLDRFAGSGSDLEAQAARDALLDVLDQLLPDENIDLEDVRLGEEAVMQILQQYLSALIYNRAIPVIDERLTRLQDQQLAQQRDGELRDFIAALVRLRTQSAAPLEVDWSGPDGQSFIERMLRDVYAQLEEWG